MDATEATWLGPGRPPQGDPRQPKLGLGEAARIFFEHRSPRLLVGLLASLAVLRLVVGAFGPWDLVVIAALVAWHPMSEWLIHVFVLHFEPRRIWGRRFDFLAARYHRAHHRHPHDPRFWFIPLLSAMVGFVIALVLSAVLMPTTGLKLTALLATVGLGLMYEWVHYLCHSSYRPRSAWFRRIWRHHRLHHFKNERYWMGVSMHVGDRILRTNPDPKEVPTSPRCRDLLAKDE